MFNLKEFVLNNLISGVKNKSFSKEYASILATNYFLKNVLTEQDIQKFDAETTVEETIVEDVVVDAEVENTVVDNTEEIEVVEEIKEAE